jgi:hypothetical protein
MITYRRNLKGRSSNMPIQAMLGGVVLVGVVALLGYICFRRGKPHVADPDELARWDDEGGASASAHS